MKVTYKKVTLTLLFMAAVMVFTFIGCKKTSLVTNLTPQKLKGYEESIKAHWAGLSKIDKLPTQIFDVNIPVATFLADENNNPLPQTNAPAACNFTTPVYCNLVQYARMYDCEANTGNADGGYYLQFTYELSWDNSIYTKTSKGYLKIYDAATNALVVNQIISYNNKIDVTNLGADFSNPGNNKYRVVFTAPTAVSRTMINAGTAYNVFTSALFGTTCANGTNYLVGSAAVTSSNFTGASGNDPCKRNDKIQCLLAGSTSVGYAPSAYVNTLAAPDNTCNYNSTFIIPNVVEVEYSLNDGVTFLTNMTASSGSLQNYLKYPGFTFTSAPNLTTGTYNLVFRYKNWKYGDPAKIGAIPFNIPSLTATPPDCTNTGSPTAGSGFTYYYYGNVIIP